jgi:hypothetical protein
MTSLVSQYREIAQYWRDACSVVDLINIRQHDDVIGVSWGDEQRKTPSRFKPGGQAPDVPMAVDPTTRFIGVWSDWNGLREDPVSDSVLFAKRNQWAPEEVAIFFEKYEIYPRKFARIARYLPGKSTKDVIEYYYMCLGRGETAMGKRRIRKKMYTEGKVKTDE